MCQEPLGNHSPFDLECGVCSAPTTLVFDYNPNLGGFGIVSLCRACYVEDGGEVERVNATAFTPQAMKLISEIWAG